MKKMNKAECIELLKLAITKSNDLICQIEIKNKIDAHMAHEMFEVNHIMNSLIDIYENPCRYENP